MSDSILKKPMAYAAGLALAVTLSACSGGDPSPPATSAPTTPTATSVTTPTTTPPSSSGSTTAVDPVLARIPAVARPETPAGAEAFATFYFEQLNRAFTTGSPEPLRGLSAEACETCVGQLKGAKELQSAGQHHRGLSIEVTHSRVRDFVSAERSVLTFVEQHSVPVVNTAGTEVKRTKAGEGAFVVTLAYDGRWIVTRLQVAK